jgi:hypothetical protein
MDEVDRLAKALEGAEWNSDLLARGMRQRFPGVRTTDDATEMRRLVAAGYKVRAVTRSPYWPERVVPNVYLSPATAEEQRDRGIGSKLAEMVSGDDLRRAGLRR